jgi:hypothetical protein
MVDTVTVWLVATLGLSARSEEMIASQATDTKTCLLDYFSPHLHRDALEFLAYGAVGCCCTRGNVEYLQLVV